MFSGFKINTKSTVMFLWIRLHDPKTVQMSAVIDNQRVKAVPLLVQSRQSDHLTYSYYLSTINLVHTLLGDEYITGRWSKSTCIDKVLTRLIGFPVAAMIAASYCVLLSASRFFNWPFPDFWSTSSWVRGCCEKPNNGRGSSEWRCWWVGSSCIV